MSYLADFVGKRVLVVATDGRLFVGRLLGFDLSTNLLLTETDEIVVGEATEVLPLGLFLLRGSSLVCCGLLDEEQYQAIDWTTVCTLQNTIINELMN